MSFHQFSFVAVALGLTCGLAFAQPGAAGGRCGPGAAASGPAGDCPMGMGSRVRSGQDATPGWGMMSRDERLAHRDKLNSFKSYDECKTYLDQHHEQMMSKARDKGLKPPAQPRRDPCAVLKPALK
jgi:hypothetical protein